MKRAVLFLTGVYSALGAPGVDGPFFQEGADPKPPGTAWVRVEELSDEFEGEALDARKWQADPSPMAGVGRGAR